MTKTSTSTYTSTLMEKLLGKNYKWWYLVIYSFKQTNLKLSGFLIGNFASILDVLMTIYLWFIIEPTPERITYFFVGFILQSLIWSQYARQLTELIFTGKVVNLLLIPIPTFKFWVFKEIGSASLKNLSTAGLILVFLPFYLDYLKLPTINYVFLFPILISIAFFIDFCVSYMFSSVAFWTEDYASIGFLIVISVKFLSGIAIPFEFLPQPVDTLLRLNPYSYINYHPMQIYLGKYTLAQIGWTLLGGITWCFVYYFLAKWLFRMGLKRNESMGL